MQIEKYLHQLTHIKWINLYICTMKSISSNSLDYASMPWHKLYQSLWKSEYEPIICKLKESDMCFVSLTPCIVNCLCTSMKQLQVHQRIKTKEERAESARMENTYSDNSMSVGQIAMHIIQEPFDCVKITKHPSQIGWPRELNPGSSDYKSCVLPRSHLSQ